MKSRGVSLRNAAEYLRGLSWSFSAKTLGEISDFYFSAKKILFRTRGVPPRKGCSAAKRKKRAFFLG